MISFGCNRAAHPPATFSWGWVARYDLDRATMFREKRESRAETRSEEPALPEPAGAKPKTAPGVERSTTKLSAAKVAALRARLDEVLRRGPYEPIHPRSGMTSCTLRLEVAGQPPFFQIERAPGDRKIDDAVTQLIEALGTK
jgi:hypothetical protein